MIGPAGNSAGTPPKEYSDGATSSSANPQLALM